LIDILLQNHIDREIDISSFLVYLSFITFFSFPISSSLLYLYFILFNIILLSSTGTNFSFYNPKISPSVFSILLRAIVSGSDPFVVIYH